MNVVVFVVVIMMVMVTVINRGPGVWGPESVPVSLDEGRRR